MSSLEKFATDILDCGTADLSMLDDLYSTLGNEVIGDHNSFLKGICSEYQNNIDLNVILYELYYWVTNAIQEEIRENLENDAWPEYSKEKEFFLKQNDKLNEYSPYTNFLDTHFQNDLDDTVDWDTSVQENAIKLLEYWRKNK